MKRTLERCIEFLITFLKSVREIAIYFNSIYIRLQGSCQMKFRFSERELISGQRGHHRLLNRSITVRYRREIILTISTTTK